MILSWKSFQFFFLLASFNSFEAINLSPSDGSSEIKSDSVDVEYVTEDFTTVQNFSASSTSTSKPENSKYVNAESSISPGPLEVKVDATNPGDFEETITYQVKKHGVRSHSNFPLLTWIVPRFSQGPMKKKDEVEEEKDDTAEKIKQKVENLEGDLRTLKETLQQQIASLSKSDRNSNFKEQLESMQTLIEGNEEKLSSLEETKNEMSEWMEDFHNQVANITSHFRVHKNVMLMMNESFSNQLKSISTKILSLSEGQKGQNGALASSDSEIKNLGDALEDVKKKVTDVYETGIKRQYDKIKKGLIMIANYANALLSLVLSTPLLFTKDGPLWIEQREGCGGNLIGEAGIISYNFRQLYENNERCIWTVRANRRNEITIQLLEDNFQNSSNTDFITITEFVEGHPAALLTSSRIEHGDESFHKFRGPLIFVTFYSDTTVQGKGFVLKFQGTGNKSSIDDISNPNYSHYHFDTSVGHLTYPMLRQSLYQPYELATFVINPPSSMITRIHMKYADMEKESNCGYDSLSFYGSVTASVALTSRYCQQYEVFSGEALQSADGTFIIIFRSDGSNQFKGFQFTWENGAATDLNAV